MPEDAAELYRVDHHSGAAGRRRVWPTVGSSCTIHLPIDPFPGGIIRIQHHTASVVPSVVPFLVLALGIVFGFVSPAIAAAQSAEPAPATPAEKRWKASAELAYSDQTGNRTLRVLTGGLKASHLQKDLFRLDVSLQSRYGESDESVVARNHYGSLAFDLSPSSTWSPFLFADAEHDRFKRLDVRVSGGAGAKYTLYRSDETRTEASLSGAMLVSHESIVPLPDDPDPRSRTVARWSFRARGTQELPAGATIDNTTFFQPLHDRMADYLLRSETTLRMALTQRLALSVGYQLNRTSLPPAGVEPDDRILRTGIIIDF